VTEDEVKAAEVKAAEVKAAEVNDKLWAFAMGQEGFIIQEFGTAIVGIGALFFAYGELTSSVFIRVLIALIGLGSSMVIWIHSFGASMDRKGVFDYLGGSPIRVAHKKVASWRSKRRYLIFYPSTLRIITYFSGLVALAWLLLVINGFDYIWYGRTIPFKDFEYSLLLSLCLTLVLLIFRRLGDKKKYGG
jgi:hypothetical protein